MKIAQTIESYFLLIYFRHFGMAPKICIMFNFQIKVSIKMEDDPQFGPFDGVFYTRGSFSSAK